MSTGRQIEVVELVEQAAQLFIAERAVVALVGPGGHPLPGVFDVADGDARMAARYAARRFTLSSIRS